MKQVIISTLVAAALSACAVGPDYAAPSDDVAVAWTVTAAQIQAAAAALAASGGAGGTGGGGLGGLGSLLGLGAALAGAGSAAPNPALVSDVTGMMADPAFAGLFANGGLIPRGQFGIVGEAGPEPVFATPSGVGVLPNSALRSMGEGGDHFELNSTFILPERADPRRTGSSLARANEKSMRSAAREGLAAPRTK